MQQLCAVGSIYQETTELSTRAVLAHDTLYTHPRVDQN